MKFQPIREYILRAAGNRRYRYTVLAATPLVGIALAAAGPLDAGTAPTEPAGSSGTVTARSGAQSGPPGAGPAPAAGTPAARSAAAQPPADKAPEAGKGQDAGKSQDTGKSAQKAAAVPAPPEAKTVRFSYQRQPNYYYCGPAATRIAASSFGAVDTQDGMARRLGTTTAGTNSAQDTTRTLNSLAGQPAYRTTEVPGRPGAAHTIKTRWDVVRAISSNRAVVANVAGSTVDTAGVPHSYPGGHYVSVVGYGGTGSGVLVADPAYLGGDGTYWLTVDQLTNWMGTRGYSA